MWTICGQTLNPGEKRRLSLSTGIDDLTLPATLICGAKPGKTVLIVAGTHPDEYPGIAALLQVGQALDPSALAGNVLLLHCLNPSGFRLRTRTVPEDGFNLNGNFPGRADGTVGARLAHFVETALYPHMDFILDLHSGSPMEPLTPCVFFPSDPAVRAESLRVAESLDVGYLLESSATGGLYSYAATRYGIPALLLERGHSGLCLPEWVEADRLDILRLLTCLGLLTPAEPLPTPAPKEVYTRVHYPEAAVEGLWYPAVREGERIRRGQMLGCIRDLWGECLQTLVAEGDGVVFYYTGALSIRVGDSLVAYGICPKATIS